MSFVRLCKPVLVSVVAILPIQASWGLEGNCAGDIIEPSNDLQQFIQFDTGLVIDATTNLMWSTCSVGQSYVDGSCEGQATDLDWAQALQAVEQLNADGFKGYADWRMPNIAELDSIIERACTEPTVDLAVWPSTPADFYHTSTPDTRTPDERFAANRLIDFSTGLEARSGYDGRSLLRIVRSVD